MGDLIFRSMMDDDLHERRWQTFNMIQDAKRDLECLSLPRFLVERNKRQIKELQFTLKEIESEMLRRGDSLYPLEDW